MNTHDIPIHAPVEAGAVIFLVLDSRDRITLATTIERLIGLLDEQDADPDLEDTGDDEASLGWGQQLQATLHVDTHDEAEDENEHGGNITDEPHDALDEGNDEPFLGWSEKCSMWNDPDVQKMADNVDPDDIDVVCRSGALKFNGDGAVAARTALRNLERVRPDVRQHKRHGWCGGDYSALRVEGLAIKSNKGRVRRDPDELTIVRPGVAMIGFFR